MNKPDANELYESNEAMSDSEATTHFLRLVGERVRLSRTRMGLSRKTLSECSGVSQRYLAQLEAGEGNISIALLRRISEALNHRIEWLVTEDDPWTSDIATVTSLFRLATKAQRDKVIKILNPESKARRANRVALIGLRGAGKSTLGRKAASTLNVPFLELNEEVELISGMPVNEIIALYGQEGYRHLERQAAERVVASYDAILLAAAGGIVSNPATFQYLLRHFHTVWLRARPEEHMSRVRAQGDTRPMAGNPEAMNELQAILRSRESLYASADVSIDTSGKSESESLSELLVSLQRGIMLNASAAGPAVPSVGRRKKFPV